MNTTLASRAATALLNREMKFWDSYFPVGTTDLSLPFVGESMHLIPRGSAGNQRIGRKVVLKKLGLRSRINMLLTAGQDCSATHFFRYMVVLDTQCNGVSPTATQILETNAAAGGDPSAATAVVGQYTLRFNRIANKHRFRVLFDRTFSFTPQTATWRPDQNAINQGDVSVHFDWFKNVNIPIDFSEDSAVPSVAAVRTNNLMCFYVPSPQGTLVDFTAQTLTRVRYVD